MDRNELFSTLFVIFICVCCVHMHTTYVQYPCKAEKGVRIPVVANELSYMDWKWKICTQDDLLGIDRDICFLVVQKQNNHTKLY